MSTFHQHLARIALARLRPDLLAGERTHALMRDFLALSIEAFVAARPAFDARESETYLAHAIERGAQFVGAIILDGAHDTAEAYDNGHKAGFAAGMREVLDARAEHAVDCESERNAPGACDCSPEVDEPSVGEEPRS